MIVYEVEALRKGRRIGIGRNGDFDKAWGRACEIARLDPNEHFVALAYLTILEHFISRPRGYTAKACLFEVDGHEITLRSERFDAKHGDRFLRQRERPKPPLLVLRKSQVGPGRMARTVEEWTRAARVEAGLPDKMLEHPLLIEREKREHGTPAWRQCCIRYAEKNGRAVVLRSSDRATVITWLPGSSSPGEGPRRPYVIEKD
jgi:hypothetical protein